MNVNMQHIARQLFHVHSMDDVSLKQMEDLRDQYPFFNIGHYLLSKKLLHDKADGFLDETKKTALYFNNPFWLQWVLQNIVSEKLPESKASVEIENKVHNTENSTMLGQEPADEIPASPHVEQIQELKVAVPSKGEELLFNSYHTVDYFASLGIKLILDENSNDKFGKQLKSFTDWLKIMKRLPQKVEDGSAETAIQASIDGFAAHSLQQKEIITEAMAEVLAKQGKNEDAMMLYQKLSLLNPAKSAYFAAKIDKLKEL